MPRPFRLLFALVAALTLSASSAAAPKYKALIIDGQNNHNWLATTPILKQHLLDSGLFSVDVATSPAKGQDMSGFQPKFSDYSVVVSNYNGDEWPQPTKDAFVEYVRAGGGVVIVHAADNAFPKWKEYNQMIGVGGWGGRNEKSGPYIRVREGKTVLDTKPGGGGHHGKQHPFTIVTRDPEHPIMAGLPKMWMHEKDELYDSLRGPAENVDVLATAYSSPDQGGTGENEPALMTIGFGEGRVFHTTLGHSPEAMRCVGFIVTLQRGAEWSASGEVTQQQVPSDFPTVEKVSIRGG
jgi:type 1 glutamine amidotransferase